MTQPLISVITTSFNTAKFLPEALDSILNQTFQNWELLIADDKSNDNSAQIIDSYAKKDSRIKPYHNAENRHYLRTRNDLFKKAKGDYITLLDSDDRMEPTRLEEQLRFMQANPELAFCGCLVKYMDEKSRSLKTNRPKPELEYESILAAFPKYNPFTGSTVFIKTKILLEFDGYRDFFHGLCSEDYDLFSRIAEKYPCANLDRELYIYRQFSESTSRAQIFTNSYKRFSGQLAQWFISQRKEGGKDSLDLKEFDKIEEFVQKLQKQSDSDPSKIHLDCVTSHLYVGLKAQAFKSSIRAIVANPLSVYNYRTFVYVLKQILKST